MSPLDDLQPQMDWGQNDPVFSDAPSFVDSLPALTPDQQKQEQSDFDKADPFAALDPSATAINPGNVGPVGGGDLNGASYATGSIPFNTIIRIEGGTNRDGSFRTSPKGAWGPAQLMPDTLVQAAKMAGVTPDQARTNAAANIAAGNAYYEHMRGIFGNDAMAAAAYNAGPGSQRLKPGDQGYGRGVYGAMARATAAGNPAGWFNYLPRETQDYVRKATGGGSRAPMPAQPTMQQASWGANDPVVTQTWGANDPVVTDDKQTWGEWASRKGNAALSGLEQGAATAERAIGSAVRFFEPGAEMSGMGEAGMSIDRDTHSQLETQAAQHQAAINIHAATWDETAQKTMPDNPTFGEKVISGAASMVPALAASAIPVVGVPIAAGIFGQAGYDEAYKAAYEAAMARAPSAKAAFENDGPQTPAQEAALTKMQREDEARAAEIADTAGKENAAISAGLSLIPGERLIGGIAGSVAKKFGINVTSKVGQFAGRTATRAGGNAAMVGGMRVGANVVAQQNGEPGRPTFEGAGMAAFEGALGGEIIHGAMGVGKAAYRGVRGRFAGSPDAGAETGAGDNPNQPGSGPDTGPMPGTNAARDYAGDTWGNNDPVFHEANEAGFGLGPDGNPMGFGSVKEAAQYLVKNKLAGQFEPALHADGTVGIRMHAAETARRAPKYLPDGTKTASDELQAHAEEAGVPSTPETPHDTLQADVIEKEAATGEPTHEQANIHEQQVDSLLDPADEAALNAHIAPSIAGEHGTGVGAFPVSGHGNTHFGTPEADRERAAGTEGSRPAAEAPGGSRVAALTPTASGKGVVLTGATEAQKDAIHEALPQATASASGNGGLVFSAKHADVIREILAQNAPAAPAPSIAGAADVGLSVLTDSGKKLRGDLIDMGNGIDAVGARLGIMRERNEGTLSFAHAIVTSRPREAIQRAMVAESTSAPEHPGLVIKSLQTGKETAIQPNGTMPPKDRGPVTQMPGNRTLKEHKLQGWNAALAGFKLEDDPYYATSPVSDAWRAGWRDGMKTPAKVGDVQSRPRSPSDRGADASYAGEKRSPPRDLSVEMQDEWLKAYDRATRDAKPNDQNQSIGKNADGNNIYENENGVRSYAHNGVRRTEPVELIPTRDRGYVTSVDLSRRGNEFKTESERASFTDEPAGAEQAAEQAKPEEPAAEPKPARDRAEWGSKNKGTTRAQYEEIRRKIAEKMNANRMNSGIDPELAALGMRAALFHIEAGARRFGEFAHEVMTDLGELGITPAMLRSKLRSWYNGARDEMEDMGESVAGMDKPDHVAEAMKDFEALANRVEQAHIAPEETANAGTATQSGTGINDRGGNESLGADDVSALVGAAEVAGGAEGSGGAGGAELRAGDEPGTVQGAVEPNGLPGVGVEPDAGAQQGGEDRDSTGRRVSPGTKPAAAGGALDYHAPLSSLTREGSWRATAERNLDIVELVNRLDAEGRHATPEEQALLAKFTGWGAGEIRNNLFRNIGRNRVTGEREINPWGAPQDWRPLAERAAQVLKGEDLETALQSVQYAHYTSEPVIRSIWSALDRFGFKGGKMMEPGMGTGLFAVAAPPEVLNASHYTGIEYDKFTAKIAGYLLPQERVISGDFVKTKLPNGFFDVAVGNPPFSATKVMDDPAYRKLRLSLHDYFFAKSIDKVRPGGLMVFVTSRYTMDKLNDQGRQYLGERADLLGAIRLPQTAFKGNAGTEVVTDVLFFQKRPEGVAPGGQAWQGVKEVKAGEGKSLVNEYFADHPEMVLGTHAQTGSMYRKDEYTVEPHEGDIVDHFAKAVESLPRDIYAPMVEKGRVAAEAKTFELDMRPAAEKEGGLYVKDGQVFVRENGIGMPILSRGKLSPQSIAWLKDYTGLRDALKVAQRDQLGDGDWDKSLKALNKAYDAFVKKHGPISTFTTSERTFVNDDTGEETTRLYRRFKNANLLRLDIESPLVESLEKITDDGKIVKGPFLNGRTLNRPTRPRIESVQDALMVGLDEIGKLDLDYIAGLAKMDREGVIEALGDAIYMHPKGDWQTADEYLSGDVVSKLEEAITAANADPRFKRNADALQAVQPTPLGPAEITVKLGAGWIPESIVQDFAGDVLDIDTPIAYEPVTAEWAMDKKGTRSYRARSATSDFGTSDRSQAEIMLAVLNNQTIKVTRTVDKTTVVDTVATAAAIEKAKQLAEKFREWVWQDPMRAKTLLDLYNRRFNNIAPRRFDGSHLTTPGLSGNYTLYPHQKRAIWRIIQTGNTYLNHAVGAGKTLEMIVGSMESKRLGLIKKPMFAVPRHMLNQFAREFLEAYPAANIMVADHKAFHTDNRKRFMAQAALNDPDAIIVPHTALTLIDTMPESRAKIVNQMIAELEAAMKGAEERHTRSKIEKQIENIKRKFEGKAASEGKDKALTFEDMGIDHLFVDEAHEFRKLDFVTNRAVKGIDPNGSQRALDLYIKTRWLEAQQPGRSLVMSSGTPITNTMAEVYTVMRYMAEAELERDGLRAFDAWANMFGEVATGYEQNAAGGYEPVERFAKFVNVPELMKRVRQFMDVLTSNQLGDLVKRPTVNGGGPHSVVTPPVPALRRYMDTELANRIRVSKNWKPSPNQPANPDPIIAINTDARLSSIDMRFINPALPNDPGSKLNMMVDRIVDTHNAIKQIEFTDPKTGQVQPVKGGTQIVFSMVGFGEGAQKNRGFDLRGFVDKRLIEGGFKRSEIAWVSDASTPTKKEELFKEMRAGRVKVLFGSPKNMGTGLNVQNRLRALHYLSPPWYPADVEQPHGRIIRQGNWNPNVDIYWYATKGTYDSTAWGMVSRKARFIEQAMKGDDSIRTLDDISEANQYEMAAALAAGDERVIKVTGLSADIERLTRLQSAHAGEQRELAGMVRNLQKYDLPNAEAEISRLTEANAARDPAAPFSLSADGRAYDKPGEGGAALHGVIAREFAGWQDDPTTMRAVQVGAYQGKFPIMMEPAGRGAGFDLSMKIAGHDFPIVQGASNPDDVSESGLGSRISNALARLPGAVRDMQNQLNQSQAELVAAQRKLGLPFPKANELAEKVAERAQLQAEMAAETKAAEEAAKKAAEAAKAAPDTVKESRAPYGVSPATLKDFRNNWVAHIDLRGDNREAIERDGFRKGYVNALMPWTGGSRDSVDAMAWNYRPRAGQAVYLVPPGGWHTSPNGAVINEGWKPGNGQVVTVEHDGQSLYDLYRKAFDGEPKQRAADATAVTDPATKDDLVARLEQTGLSNKVALTIVDTLGGAAGQFHRSIITIAMDGTSAMDTLNHEIIHAIKPAFTANEWAALARTARADAKLMASIRVRYPDLGATDQTEEAVADMFARFARDEAQPRGLLATAWAKLKGLFEAIGNALRGRGFVSADDVMRSADQGDISARMDDMGGADDVVRYSKRDEEAPKTGPGAIITRILGKHTESGIHWLADKADKAMPDPVADIRDAIGMGINPMGEGSNRAQATVKDFANALRLNAFQWGKLDEWLKKTFNEDARRRMWNAADEEGVILRRGDAPGPHEGMNRLSPTERQTVEELQRRADASYAEAVKLGMVQGEGLESYVPRMIVQMTAEGPRVLSRTSPRQERRGGKLSTTTGQLRQRKYETVEETEAAAQAAFGASVEVVRDIRTLGLATQRLDQAIAGRTLVQKIKAMSKDAGGGELVLENGNPDPGAYFTLDHPALKTWAPRFTADPDTGKVRPLLDETGHPIFEEHPVWISREFEGPLKAVLRSPNGPVIKAFMALKAKAMGIIMYSPFMHNMVIFGKALPADPVGMLKLLEPYRLGNRFRKDPAMMQEAITAGLVPIGARYFMQDIAGIAAGDGLDVAPGRSWTAQGLALIPGLFSKDAGNAVKRSVDKFGDIWHNTFLWDRVADLQAGLYVHMRDGFIASGADVPTAQRAAAHYANRYAGALPIEALSTAATNTANLLLFSRSFTLGNLGAFKDLTAGLPSDVRAQVERDGKKAQLDQVQGLTRRKAMGMFMVEIAFQHLGLIAAAAAMAWLYDEVYQAPSDNEEGRTNRFLIRYENDGTAIYGRLPTGKVAEDWEDWVTQPRQTFLNKQSPYAKLGYQIVTGDAGFGHKLYDPDDSLQGRAHDLQNIGVAAVSGILPERQFEAINELAKGTTPDRGATWMQAFLPVVGITISHGSPGGPAIGDIYRAKDEEQYRLGQAKAGIVKQIKQGDIVGARAEMTEVGVAPSLQNYIIRSTINPQLRMSARQVRDFMAAASPEQREQFLRDREQASARAPAP